MTDEPNKVTGPWSLAAFYVHKHGPITFGVISVLIMWQLMVRPELDRKAMDTAAMLQITREMREQQKASEQMADHIRTTAMILDEITKRQTSANQ